MYVCDPCVVRTCMCVCVDVCGACACVVMFVVHVCVRETCKYYNTGPGAAGKVSTVMDA